MNSFTEVDQFAERMRAWAKTIESRLSQAPDVTQLHAEADELRSKYDEVPAQIRELEQAKATLEASVAYLHASYEIIEANLSLGCDGKNTEQRKAQLHVALATHEEATQLMREIGDKELNIKLLAVEIEEKERLWSDYHRQVIILASKAGLNIYR